MSRKFVQKFWSWIGAPLEFDNEESEKSWVLILRDCQGETQYDDETFVAFMKFACITNQMSAEYLRKANDPCKCFKKNLLVLKRRFEAEAIHRPSIKPRLVEVCQYNPRCLAKGCNGGLIREGGLVNGKATPVRIICKCACFKIVKIPEGEANVKS